MGEYGFELGRRGRLKHGYACGAEVGDAFEQGRCRKMASYVQDAAVVVDALDAFGYLAAQARELFGGRQGRGDVGGVVAGKSTTDVAEHPGGADGGAAHHDAVHSIVVECAQRIVAAAYVAVADEGDVQARVLLDARYHLPVGLAGVHLRARAAVDRECRYAAVLQALGEFHDDAVVVVPAEAGFHCDREADGLYDGLCDGEHARNVAQHACPGAFACHFFDRAAEIDVDYVRAGLFHDFCGLYHRVDVASVNLYCGRPLGRVYLELARGGCDVAYQGVGRHEFRVGHVGAHLFAYEAEGGVGDVLHRCESNGPRA